MEFFVNISGCCAFIMFFVVMWNGYSEAFAFRSGIEQRVAYCLLWVILLAGFIQYMIYLKGIYYA